MTKSRLQRNIVSAALLLYLGLATAGMAQVRTNMISGALTGTHNWYRTNVYQLNGMVFVRSNGVLNIEAGTVIKGHNLSTFSTNVGSLVICRGAKIYAEGTPQNPIIFTADIDDLAFPDDLDIYQRALWGGVVILGQTTINGALDADGKNANPIYEVYEGLPADTLRGGEAVLRFGGNDDNDNSGVMRYVSIRHGGAQLATDKEINGLSLCAVGRGTTIEFIEAYAIADDGFEFFGGTVNTKYLVSAFCDDDSFDVDMGYRGTNQFWFSIQAPDKRNYGLELNNQINEIATPNLLTPQSDFKVYNGTFIGSGTANTNVNGGRGAGVILRPYAGPKIYNSIFTDFNERGIELETRNTVHSSVSVTNGYAQFHNTLWWGFVSGSGSATVDNSVANLSRGTVASNYWSDASLSNQIVDPMLTSISRTNIGASLDPRPQAGSPAYSGAAATPNDGFLTPVNYQGAFGPNDLWIANWTALSQYGILIPAAQHTNMISGALTGTHNWYRTNVYQLNGMVFVRSNGVLNIEAGTVIKGHNLSTFSTNVGSLVICRGAKIYAEGTPQNPIIFTADIDDLAFPDDLDIYQRALWGGVVILGQTTINGALDADGKNANPIYEVYEGLPADTLRGGEAVLRFGGNDDNDNSGVMRYVSIRHGGAQLATDKEINGLSLCAVGRGTTIEFIEAYAIADDGFEFFGGTVNTKYLVSAFCDDDSFDVDMGYRGTNQFWFSIQAPDKRNYGLELNNQINEIATPNLLTPQSDFKVYNGTFIGSGTANTNVNGGRGAGVILRPYAGPKIYNSIFTDFNERGIELETRNTVHSSVSVTNGYAQFHNTLWWGFVSGSGSATVDNSVANLSRGTVASNYWSDASLSNQIVDPMLTSISRTNIGASLDPRPQAGSPAYSGAASSPTSLIAANYEGAFGPGRSDWASDWTALSEYGIITGAGGINPLNVAGPVGPNQPTLNVAHNGANVDITFPTQTGYNYQLQSTTDLSASPVDWQPDGSAVPGTGSSVTISRAIGGSGPKIFRVVIP